MRHDGPITAITTMRQDGAVVIAEEGRSLPNRVPRGSHAQNGLGGVRLDVLDHGEPSRKRSRSRLLPARPATRTSRTPHVSGCVPPCRSDRREKAPFGGALTRTVSGGGGWI